MKTIEELLDELAAKQAREREELIDKHRITNLLTAKTVRVPFAIVRHSPSDHPDFCSVTFKGQKGENPVDVSIELMEALEGYRLTIVHARSQFGHVRPLSFIGCPVNVLEDNIECYLSQSVDSPGLKLTFYVEIGNDALQVNVDWGLQKDLQTTTYKSGRERLCHFSPHMAHLAAKRVNFGPVDIRDHKFLLFSDYAEKLTTLKGHVALYPF